MTERTSEKMIPSVRAQSHMWLVWSCWSLLLPVSTSIAQQAVRYDAGTISGLPARNIGSATMSGRISAVTAVNEKGRLTVFVGSASGGLWKSVNGGTTFKPFFDSPYVQ